MGPDPNEVDIALMASEDDFAEAFRLASHLRRMGLAVLQCVGSLNSQRKQAKRERPMFLVRVTGDSAWVHDRYAVLKADVCAEHGPDGKLTAAGEAAVDKVRKIAKITVPVEGLYDRAFWVERDAFDVCPCCGQAI